jgi:hypothetical protein
MDELIAYRQELLSALERVVSELLIIVKDTPFKEWYRPIGHDLHTPHYTLVHLFVLEAKEFALYIRRIHDEETPLLVLFDDTAWMESHYRPKAQPRIIMQDFAHLRNQELKWLRELPPATWSRTARHPWWGVHTLQWLVELQLEYSRQHLSELSRLLGA